MALMQGAGDDSLLSGRRAGDLMRTVPGGDSHVRHAGLRFPTESRFHLAFLTTRRETQQIAAWPLPPAYLLKADLGRFSSERPGDTEELDLTLSELAKLFGDAAVGAEARLRSGVLRFLRGQHAAAAADLGAAIVSTDPSILYVASLILGMIAEERNELGEALIRYRRAHQAVPASASSVVLAGLLYRIGREDEASTVLDAFARTAPPPDPWRLYGQRDFPVLRGLPRAHASGGASVKFAAVALVVVLLSLAVIQAQQPQFRTSTTGVNLHVIVRRDGQPVRDLTARDFALTDSGVRQEIAAVDAATVPLDISVVAQEAIYGNYTSIASFEKEMEAVARLARPDDHVRVVLAGDDQREQAVGTADGLRRLAAMRKTCVPVYDALARTLMRPTDPMRQHVIVLLSVGEGAGSSLSAAVVTDIARRSNARLYVVSVEPQIEITTWRVWVSWVRCSPSWADWSPSRQARLRQIDGTPSAFKQDRELWLDSKNRLVELAELTGGVELGRRCFCNQTPGRCSAPWRTRARAMCCAIRPRTFQTRGGIR